MCKIFHFWSQLPNGKSFFSVFLAINVFQLLFMMDLFIWGLRLTEMFITNAFGSQSLTQQMNPLHFDVVMTYLSECVMIRVTQVFSQKLFWSLVLFLWKCVQKNIMVFSLFINIHWSTILLHIKENGSFAFRFFSN